MKIYQDMTELIGRTPLLALNNYSAMHGLSAPIIAKLERFNPAGSVKDRVAFEIIDSLEKSGELTHDSVIIEPTSGNTGIGLAAIAAARGYRCIIVMPDSMSVERRKLMRAYGAELRLTPGALGMKGAIAEAEALAKTLPGAVIAGQFTNPANPAAHRKTTGPEIWEDTDGTVDVFVAGVGTGGTISGAGEYLKSRKSGLTVIAVEPAGSPVLSGGKAGPHGLQGIGAGFVPETLDTGVYDRVVAVTEEQAFTACRELASSEGMLCGISSGAALYAAAQAALEPEMAGKRIVVLLPDTGERYLSGEVF